MTLCDECNLDRLDGVAAAAPNGGPAEDRQADTECARGPLDFELLDVYLLDVYAAIFVVVPLALFLKSLWS